MRNSENKEIQAREKQESPASAELTKPGPVFVPAADIFETENEITLLADMPGVKAEDVNIDLRENILTLEGDATPPENIGGEDILREYEIGKYYRQFTLSESIDQQKIEAGLNDGVLRLTLPKVEKASPRKIMVKTG